MNRGTLRLVIRLMTLELKVEAFVRALETHYRPDQPRAPKGQPDGGQWTREGGPQGADRIRTALTAELTTQLVGLGDSEMIRHCIYIDMFGRQYTKEMNAMDLCPRVLPVPPYFGPY